MSGVERIVGKILEDARIQADNTVIRAKEEALKQKQQLDQRQENRLVFEKERAEEIARREYDRILASTQLEGRKRKLAAYRESVDAAFDQALAILSSLPEEQYIAAIADLVTVVLGEGTNEIIPASGSISRDHQRLLDTIRKKAPGKTVVLSGERVRSSGGVVVRKGKVQVNLTFETMIRFRKEELEPSVMEILFGGNR